MKRQAQQLDLAGGEAIRDETEMPNYFLDPSRIKRANGNRSSMDLLLLPKLSQTLVVLQVECAANEQHSHIVMCPGLANQGSDRIEDVRPAAGYHTDRVQLLDDQQAILSPRQASQDRDRGFLSP